MAKELQQAAEFSFGLGKKAIAGEQYRWVIGQVLLPALEVQVVAAVLQGAGADAGLRRQLLWCERFELLQFTFQPVLDAAFEAFQPLQVLHPAHGPGEGVAQ